LYVCKKATQSSQRDKCLSNTRVVADQGCTDIVQQQRCGLFTVTLLGMDSAMRLSSFRYVGEYPMLRPTAHAKTGAPDAGALSQQHRETQGRTDLLIRQVFKIA
jgi:hypothetical protein